MPIVMATSRTRGNTEARDVEKHPAGSSIGLATAVAIGFGTALFLIATDEKSMRRVARRVVAPAPADALRNQFRRAKRRRSLPLIVAGGVIASAAIAGAFATLDAITAHPATRRFDHHLHNFFRKHRNAAQRDVVKMMTGIGSPIMVVPLDIAASVVLLRRDKVHQAVALTWTLIATSVISEGLKNTIRRPRPPEGKEDNDEFSFPSGHTMLTVSSYALIAYFLADEKTLGSARFAVAALFLAAIPWTTFSRMYLGMHWPSDTIAGMALGIAWDAAIISFLRIK